ncbi:MAG TPA: hypothetical protein VGN61_04390 [Verrucomicrobiae bacterium]|jgi:hypothetical protein
MKPTAATISETLTIDKLIGLSRKELDDLFTANEPGPIPVGNSQGAAIVNPGSMMARIIRRFVYTFAWQGKIFTQYKCPKCGDLVLTLLENKIGPTGINTIEARVYYDASWLDGKKVIVLDYSKTSFVAQKIRDEIRLVSPNLYLGKVWWGKTRLIDFALQF